MVPFSWVIYLSWSCYRSCSSVKPWDSHPGFFRASGRKLPWSPGDCIKHWSVHCFNFHCGSFSFWLSSIHNTIPSLFRCHCLMCGGWWQCYAQSLWSLSELVCLHLWEELEPKPSSFRGLESHHYWREFREEWKKWLGAWRDWCMRKDQRGWICIIWITDWVGNIKVCDYGMCINRDVSGRDYSMWDDEGNGITVERGKKLLNRKIFPQWGCVFSCLLL